jgi:divalent metal cation (Fe/Co/Zn/Cd) transporter
VTAQLAPGVTSNSGTLRRKARLLVLATIAWNVVEAVVAISAGAVAGSTALIGFGLDAVVEVSAALIALWYLSGVDETRERRALKMIAGSFFALAAYVAFEAVRDLLTAAEPDRSTIGIVLTSLSLVIMPMLARAKRRNAERLGSRTLLAESQQTQLCTYLSAIVLVGLILRAAFDWTWADPVAALGIAALAIKEGREAWRGEDSCCTPTH